MLEHVQGLFCILSALHILLLSSLSVLCQSSCEEESESRSSIRPFLHKGQIPRPLNRYCHTQYCQCYFLPYCLETLLTTHHRSIKLYGYVEQSIMVQTGQIGVSK